MGGRDGEFARTGRNLLTRAATALPGLTVRRLTTVNSLFRRLAQHAVSDGDSSCAPCPCFLSCPSSA